MSARIGVVAVRGVALAKFLETFPTLESNGPRVDAGWTWVSFNLFGQAALAGPQAEALLTALDRPALQAWTEDGALWYLAVYLPGRPAFRHVHWFRYHDLVAGKEKVKKGTTLRRYIEHYEDDLPEDYKYAGPLPEGPIGQAMAEHLRVQAGALSEALESAGGRHDHDALRAALTGESVTDEEWGWDVGNLPRLLDIVGLPDVVPGWKDEIAAERQAQAEHQAQAEAAAHAPPDDLVAPILARLGSTEPAAIKGGPVTVDPALLWLLPWACQDDVEIGWMVKPEGAAKPRWPKLEHLSVVEHDGTWRVGHPWVSVWMREKAYQALAKTFAALPDGSEVELVTASVPEDDDHNAAPSAGNMRFRGTIKGKAWKVTHASPATSAADLKSALAIFAWIAGRGAFTAKSAAEAKAVAELGRAGGHFGDEKKDQPVVSGKTITVKARHWRHYLALTLFRHRFAEGPWDVRSAQEADARDQGEFDPMLADLGTQLTSAFAAPRGDDTVFQGKHSTYRRADILKVQARLNLAELFKRLYPARDVGGEVDLPRAIGLVEEAMAGLGFKPIGDMVCEAFGDIVLRGYGRPAGDAYALTYAGTVGQFLYEFNTRFSDGSSQTTSIHHGKNRRELLTFHAWFPNASVEELFEHHVAAVKKRTTTKVKPESHPMNLAVLAERIDDFLVKTAA